MSQSVGAQESLTQYLAGKDVAAMRKQPRLLALLFCDFYNQTADGKTNLIGIFDRVFVHPEIKQTHEFVLYIRTAEAFSSPIWLRVFDPDNESVLEMRFVGPTKEQAPPDRDPSLPIQAQILLPLVLSAKKEGIYWFDVAYGNIPLGGANLALEYRKGEQLGGTDTFL